MSAPITKFVDVVCDSMPGPNSCRFVELEDENGKGIDYGQWVDRGNGLVALRIPLDQNNILLEELLSLQLRFKKLYDFVKRELDERYAILTQTLEGVKALRNIPHPDGKGPLSQIKMCPKGCDHKHNPDCALSCFLKEDEPTEEDMKRIVDAFNNFPHG